VSGEYAGGSQLTVPPAGGDTSEPAIDASFPGSRRSEPFFATLLTSWSRPVLRGHEVLAGDASPA
jgi:hypothetical protein